MVAELKSTPEPSVGESQLSIRSVWKSFGGAPVLRDVDLDVAPGELVALLGPSGCGKTTLLRLIAGFIAPDSGTIVIDNKDQTKVPPHRRRVGMVHQNYALWPHMTVAENVSFGLEMRGESRDEIAVKVDRILEMVELDGYKTRLPGQLSGGQQQRVSLARALVTEPEVMLLDEPLSSLDANLRSQLQRHLRDVVKTLGVTTVMVTHDREEAMAISNRIVAMRDGAVVQSDSARGLYHDPVTPFVMQFTGDTNLFWGAVAEVDSDRVVVDSPLGKLTLDHNSDGFAAGERVQVGIRPEDLVVSADPAPAAGAFAIPGTVHDLTFLGAVTSYDVKIAESETVTVRTPTAEAEAVLPGESVLISGSLGAVHLFKTEKKKGGQP